MSDQVQPGVEIDRGVWKRFREDIESRKGHVRGHLRTELEAAIQQYIGDRNDPALERVEAKVDHIAAELDADVSGVAPHARSADTRTHADADTPDERPAANAATEKKVAWLAKCVLDREVPNTRELDQVPKATLRDVVKDEYGFRKDTAKRYVGELKTHFDLVKHPTADPILVTESRRAELVEKQLAEQEANL